MSTQLESVCPAQDRSCDTSPQIIPWKHHLTQSTSHLSCLSKLHMICCLPFLPLNPPCWLASLLFSRCHFPVPPSGLLSSSFAFPRTLSTYGCPQLSLPLDGCANVSSVRLCSRPFLVGAPPWASPIPFHVLFVSVELNVF